MIASAIIGVVFLLIVAAAIGTGVYFLVRYLKHRKGREEAADTPFRK
ncbi:hypothetical protein [Bifidobacterium psychraerophilum]|jgi:uncharacterized membrane-anchored protein|uniref:Uncharacterized protein n=1 Tax=Bifidobacterium psychraerophilum TaxID=218140 RepID=A0A087CHS3_9BIFI|nr:hypothetical protein [Bifidobacterium psychraerophilum]KFI82823.1 hypothetical protein BPSY_0614 [Bifidobacterium psychraerophilum]MCI1659525.1 hypothetical protein [Bifidobacterium psychraerophilum]MCI1804507.1 hypothetical protein [Bifidobacterium psychraerophilum]MCI2176337.1 hypothetical protein [Bifidobacterium psychraerophilum]MCI2181189.1 hypothetical protein [Bifidobacterium psychraerophilum]